MVGQIFVRQKATTCLSLRQEHSSADGVSMLQPQPSGTRFHHSSAHHPLVADNLEGLKTHLFTRAYGPVRILLLKSILLPAIRSSERRARYLFYCMFFSCLFAFLLTISRQPAGRFTPNFACGRTLVPDVSSPLLGVSGPRGGRKKGN